MRNKERIIPFSATHVGSIIKDELEFLGLTQAQLAEQTGIAKTVLNELLKGKRGLNADMAVRISGAINIPDELLMKIQSKYEIDCARIRLRDEADVQANEELKRYGEKINFNLLFRRLEIDTTHLSYALNSLCELLNVSSLEEVPLAPAFSRSMKSGLDYRQLTTWTILARCNAAKVSVCGLFSLGDEEKIKGELVSIFNENVDTENRTKDVLTRYGIKYCVEPKLEKASVNGCSFMSNGIPAIVVTKRINTIDNFAFTIMHELCHVYNHLTDGCEPKINFDDYSDDALETEANTYAQNALIDKTLWEYAPAVKMVVPDIQREYSGWAKANHIHKWIVLGRISREIGIYSFKKDPSRILT